MTTPVPLTDLRDAVAADLERITGDIVALAEINSGSYNPDGVDRCGERLADLLDSLEPETVETIPVEPAVIRGTNGDPQQAPVGSALRVSKRPDAPFQVVLFGHLDTVFPADSAFQSVAVDRGGDGVTLRGPGVADCKGGLVLAVETLRLLEAGHLPQAGDSGASASGADGSGGDGPAIERDDIGWQFLALSDEEIGSRSSLALLDEAAAANHLGLGFEPALPSGGVAGARKGTLTVHSMVRGRASHVGRAHDEGRSAIRSLARLIDRVEALNERDGVTVSTGRIGGGGPLNVVPDFAIGSYNMRLETTADRDWVVERFEEAARQVAAETETTIELAWAGERPPKVRTAEIDQLLADVAGAADRLGFAIPAEDTGGCCDGNNLAAAGLPNVDSLGIAGGGIHSSDEFAHVHSVAFRAPVVLDVLHRAARRHLVGTGADTR